MKKGTKKSMILEDITKVIHNAFEYFELDEQHIDEDLSKEASTIVSEIIKQVSYLRKSLLKIEEGAID